MLVRHWIEQKEKNEIANRTVMHPEEIQIGCMQTESSLVTGR